MGEEENKIITDGKFIEKIWRSPSNSVLFLDSNKLLLKLPDCKNQEKWLTINGKKKPIWNEKFKCWQLPKSWYISLTVSIVKKYNTLYLIYPYRKHRKCAPSCWNSQSDYCECSCLGVNHGSGKPEGNWIEISEAFAVEWREKKYYCSTLKDYSPL